MALLSPGLAFTLRLGFSIVPFADFHMFNIYADLSNLKSKIVKPQITKSKIRLIFQPERRGFTSFVRKVIPIELYLAIDNN